MKRFEWPVRVYYEDTDAGGVVFFANYFKFMERARTEWLRSLGIEQDILIERDKVLFAVTQVRLNFRRPARFNEALRVTVEIVERRKASLTFQQEVRRLEPDEILCSGEVKVACLDADSFRPRPLPADLMSEILHGC